VVVKILDVNSAVRKSKQQALKQENEIQKDWCSYKAVFQCYRDQTYFQQIFLFVFIMRVSLFNAIIGYLYKYPLLQIALITLANIFVLSYLIFKRPMKQLVNLFQQIVLEVVLLPFNICVLVLAILDARGIEAIDERKTIGDVMVYINVVIPVLCVTLMAIKFTVLGYQVYKEWRSSKKGASSVEKRVQRIEELRIANRVPHSRPSHQSMNMNYLQPPAALGFDITEGKIPSSPSSITTNQIQTLDISTQNLDLSMSQDPSFALNNHQDGRNRQILDSSMSMMYEHEQNNNSSFINSSHQLNLQPRRLKSRDIEGFQSPQVVSQDQRQHHLHNDQQQQGLERRIARRKNKIAKQNQPKGNVRLGN